MKQMTDPRVVAALAAGAHLLTKDGDPMDALAAKMAKFTDEVITRTDAAEKKAADAEMMAQEIAQRLSSGRGGGGGIFDATPKSWGGQFVAADNLKHFAEDRSRPATFRVDIQTKATVVGSGGISPTSRAADVATLGRSIPRIRDLLTVVRVSDAGSVSYIQQVSRPTQAAPVAEGAVKPEAAMALALKTVPTEVIAHWIPASRQVLSDIPQLADLIDTELRFGLQEAEDAQLLMGDGVSPNLHGLISQATAYVSPITLAPDATDIDVIASAFLQNALADHPADGVVLHPSDMMRLRLLKDSEGRYILGNPASDAPPQLWGVPVVATKAIPAGEFLVGAFKEAGTIFDRWEPMVMISSEHSDFFTRNLVAIRAEMRLALAVKRPTALTYGSFLP